MQKEGFTQVQIGESINKSKSIISRELKRNSDARSGEYRYELALRKHSKRQKEKHKYRRFTDISRKNRNYY